MAVSLNTYDADYSISSFIGLQQYGDHMNGDARFAVEANNVETFGGVLQPAAACTQLEGSVPKKIETLMRFYRRWYSGAGPKDVLVAASDGKLYYRLPTATTWTQLAFPTGVTAYACNVWSWVTYEINPVDSEASVDVLLISNAKDGMFLIQGDDNEFSVTAVDTQGKKFGVIERYAERIWGGAIEDDPDTLMYSAPYDPQNWLSNPDIPEDGAGDVNQPSWDGDSFTALKAFGSQLIAFKGRRVWRVLGTDPGEFAFKEQFGGGAPYPNTISVDVERIMMLDKDGPELYDGASVNPFQQQYIQDFWATVNKAALDQSCACKFKHRLYFAVPTGTSTTNNAVLIYDTLDTAWTVRTDAEVESWLVTDDYLYFTSVATPGRVWAWGENSWNTGAAANVATRWVTPWSDLKVRKTTKGGFEVYFTPEVLTQRVTLKVSIQTEKKIKTKKYVINPLTAAELRQNKSHKQKRMHFGGTGRRFRVIFETDAGQPVWRLIGGVQLLVEFDTD